ncbi:pimeloyl-ACP methyl ester carboxylesterase [Sediminihabitans luteus]|uniref:Pimeloyl-ACP methyl ester carboxylesterase n=1 Tax=Sediminihabitans luteus TaxID=1138585 RepID=A0A2M9CEF2_9CELL|nr:alpha/beta hydrolase [Sediminihabitans luteus]PJJ70304.1 pimeloyl-ACP methyl ester carboxylesterase [Sediminihabitans luteus]GII97775.1 alpha/beta hydrolase [Sediminihabitans luteus]
MIADYTSALHDGPWHHELVPANGARFHAAVCEPAEPRPAPLVVLLHTFPQYWWAWRHQLPAIAAAGYRVAAIDLRGNGASDKPPLGYDTPMRTRDVAGVVRSLGADRAVVVGHGTGGTVAWAMAALQPAVTAGVAALAAPHPARLHVSGRRVLTRVARRHLAFAQVPGVPERALAHGDLVDRLLDDGAVVPFERDVVETYRTALRIPFAAHGALEGARWPVRSLSVPSGRRFTGSMRRRIDVPALLAIGEHDPFVRRRGVDTDAAALARHLRIEEVPGVGHYLPEEAPDAVSALLVDWLDDVTSRPGPRAA